MGRQSAVRFFTASFLLLASLFLAPAARAQDGEGEPSRVDRRVEREERSRLRRLERLERLERLGRRGPRFERDGVHLRVLRSYTLAEGETVTEPVVVIGGSASILGHAEDDVVVVGGRVRLGPSAVVDGDLVSVGGGVTMEPGSVVRGTIDEAVMPWPRVRLDPDWNLGAWWPVLAIGGTIFRLSLVLVVAVLLTLVAPGWIGSIARRPAGIAGLTGLVTEVLFVPALLLLMLVFVITVVGIPLLATIPFVLAGFAVLWAAGFAGVAVRLGGALGGSRPGSDASVAELLLGYAAIVSVTIAAHLMAGGLGWFGPMVGPVRVTGLVIEYVAWTVGLGAAVMSLFSAGRATPPPLQGASGL